MFMYNYLFMSLFNIFFILSFFSLFFPCRAVKFTSKLFGRALSKRIKATVLYATETGKSEQYAKQLCELLGHAFNAQVSEIFKIFYIFDYKETCRRMIIMLYLA